MAVAAATKLGRYEIRWQLGTGGVVEYLITEIKGHKRGVAISMAAIVLFSVAKHYYFYFARSGSRTAINSIAVLPFANTSNDQNVEYLSDAISEALLNSLTELRSVKSHRTRDGFPFKGRELDPSAVGRVERACGVDGKSLSDGRHAEYSGGFS